MKLFLIIVLMGTSLVAADAGEELLVAARRGQMADVKKLLEAGAPLESKNEYGSTPLYLAVFNGHTEVALFLLEKGANPNVTDTFYKSSILASALQKGHLAIARALIAKGVPVPPEQLVRLAGGDNVATLEAALTAAFKPEDLTAALRAAIAAKKDQAAAALRKAGAPEPKSVTVSAATLAGYAGEYVSAAIPIRLRVTAEGETLKAQGEGQEQFTLSTDSATEFSFAAAGIRMVFDDKGGLLLHQGGKQYPFMRKDSAAAPVARKVADALLAGYAGVYTTSQAPLEITVTGQEGQLAIQATGQQRIPLRSESDTEFTFAPAGVRIVFDGKNGFTLFQSGQEIVFKKKDGAK